MTNEKMNAAVETMARMIVYGDVTENARRQLRRILDAPECVSGSVEEMATDMLLRLGVPANLSGFRYLREGIRLAVEDEDILRHMTTHLYPQVAAAFSTTPIRVERNMRHGVETAFARGDLDVLSGFFGNTVSPDKGKPTNSEFLALTAQKLRHRKTMVS